MNPPRSSPEEIFRRLLDESSALLGAHQDAGISVPDDDLHRDILIPLLPAMLGDVAIRKHWHDQAATGFLARLTRHIEAGECAPRWQADDFEVHVAASYSASPDAKALSDTLLSEESLREMSAALMNQLLDVAWPKLEMPLTEITPTEEEITPAAAPESVPESVPDFEPVLAAAPVVEPEIQMVPIPDLVFPLEETAPATPVESRPPIALPRLPVRTFRRRLQSNVIHNRRKNPIRGTQSSYGGLGMPDWTQSYPLAGSQPSAAFKSR